MTPNEILAARPLKPGNVDKFSTVVYPNGSPMAPAAGSAPSESQVSAILDAYLAEEFPGNPAAQVAARSVYANPVAIAKIPSPSLRAALAGLAGTVAEPAINYLLNATTPAGNPQVASIEFVPSNQVPTNGYAAVYGAGTADAAQVEIRFNNRYLAENPMLFTSVLSHEALHQDLHVVDLEEAVTSSLDNLVAIYQIAHHPYLASLGTELSRRINSRAAQRLNSGPGSRLGLYKTNAGHQVFPGSTAATEHSWWEYAVTSDTSTTPGNPLLGQYLAAIHTRDGTACSAALFSKSLLDCIDSEGSAGLSPAELVQAAKALALRTKVEQSRKLTLSYSKGAFRGKIGSGAKACVAKTRVTLFKQKPGKDRSVKASRSRANGHFTLTLSSPKGKYYALVQRSLEPGTGVCAQDRSPKVKR